MLMPSPKMSSPSTMTSPRLTPIRSSRRRSGAIGSLTARDARCISTAQLSASTTLEKSASKLSPAVPTILPPCAAISGSTAPRSSPSARCVPASSSPIRRLKPTTSACRMAASFRFRELGSRISAIGLQRMSRILKLAHIADAFDPTADNAHSTLHLDCDQKVRRRSCAREKGHVGGLSISAEALRGAPWVLVRNGPCTYRAERRTQALDQRLRPGRLLHRRETSSGQGRIRIFVAQVALALCRWRTPRAVCQGSGSLHAAIRRLLRDGHDERRGGAQGYGRSRGLGDRRRQALSDAQPILAAGMAGKG